MDEFLRDSQNGWSDRLKCPLSISMEHSNELYDTHKVGSVENVLCLRLFTASLYEIVNGTNDGRQLMITIFEEKFLRKIEEQDIQIYESIADTVQHIAWKIRKADILALRRTNENHGWQSVRDILLNIFSDGTAEKEKTVAGMFAKILQDVHRCHSSNVSIREESPLLPKSRFNEVFRVAFLLFNEYIGEYLLKGRKNSAYEKLATRLVYFYTRLAADTWRILVTRNGPKVQTEWYMLRTIENVESEPSRTKQHHAPKTTPSNNYSWSHFNQNISQMGPNVQFASNFNSFGNQPFLRKPL